jgi:hypothetical protein
VIDMKENRKEEPIDRAKRFVKGHARADFYRMLIFFCVPVVVFIASVLLFVRGYFYAGVIIWLFFPFSRFFMIGSLKTRALNGLPVIIGILYLMVGLETGAWEKWMVLFFLVPFLSVLLKPKKHPIQYATLALSVMVLSINMLTQINIPVYLKWIFVSLIYVVFIPPLVKKRLKRFFGKPREAA